MSRVRPATIVAKVFAVTIDATYTATPTSRTLRMPTTIVTVSPPPRYGSLRNHAPM